jgi:hypothetical protein
MENNKIYLPRPSLVAMSADMLLGSIAFTAGVLVKLAPGRSGLVLRQTLSKLV